MGNRGPKLLTLLTALILLVSSGLAADDIKIKAVFVTWEPFGFIKEGKPVGFELDTFSAVMKEMNLEYEIGERPWKRCLYLVRHGLADVVISALKTEEREAYLLYPKEHISVNKTALFTTIDRNFNFDESFTSLKGKKIGITDGFSYGKSFDDADFLTKDANTKTENIVIKLMMGRYDLGIGNIPVISSIAHNRGVHDKIYFLKPLVHSQMLYAAFSKKNQLNKLVEEFSKHLTEFKEKQAYREILKKYGVSHESQIP